jgi:hypothetical protein
VKLSVEAGIIQSYVMIQIETAMLQPTLSVTTPNASVQSASDATKNSASDLSLEVKIKKRMWLKIINFSLNKRPKTQN